MRFVAFYLLIILPTVENYTFYAALPNPPRQRRGVQFGKHNDKILSNKSLYDQKVSMRIPVTRG